MVWKVITVFGIALLALSDARPPISKQSVKIEHYEKLSHVGSHGPEHHEVYAWAYPSYEFKYEVDDPHTHDFKAHHETRHGDEVNGEYWLVQPDGYKRTVKYYADKSSGFKAHVDYNKIHNSEHEDKHEESAGGEDDNSNEETSSVENHNNNNEEEERHESHNHKNESEGENEGGSEGHGEQEENEHEWRRHGVDFWGNRRGHEESGDDHNDNDEQGEQEVEAKHDEHEGENVEESQGGDEHDNGHEESSVAENKNEKRVIKHEYHFIIHHPKHH